MCDVSVSLVVAGSGRFDIAEQTIDRLQQQGDGFEIVYVLPPGESCAARLREEFDDPNARVTICDCEGSALSLCWERGLKVAEGTYVLFSEDGCLLEASALHTAYAQAQKTHADVVMLAHDHMTADATKRMAALRQVQTDVLREGRVYAPEDLGGVLPFLSGDDVRTLLVRREFLLGGGIALVACEPQTQRQLAVLVLALAERIAVASRCLVHLPEQDLYFQGDSTFVARYNALYAQLVRLRAFEQVAIGVVQLFLEDFAFEYAALDTPEARDALAVSAAACELVVGEPQLFTKDSAGVDAERLAFFLRAVGAGTQEEVFEAGDAASPEAQDREHPATERYICVGDDSAGSLARLLFAPVASADGDSYMFTGPYVFADETAREEFRRWRMTLQDDPAAPASVARWRRYSPLLNLGLGVDEKLHLFFAITRDSAWIVDSTLLSLLKSTHGAALVSYLVLLDPVRAIDVWEDLASCFDYVASYNEAECEEYGFIPFRLPIGAADGLRNAEAIESTYDLFFSGSAAGVEDTLEMLVRQAAERSVRMDLHIRDYDGELFRLSGVHKAYGPSDVREDRERKEKAESACLLELVGDNEYGCSRAYVEALRLNKCLLTKNPDVAHYPLYNPAYMRIFQTPDGIDFAWLKSCGRPMYESVHDYTPKAVLEQVALAAKGLSTHERPTEYSHVAEPLVSVVVPTYNRAATILRSVESVLRQTYRKLELIVVDDGSQDETCEILERVNDVRLRVVSIPNSGACAARNVGIRMARGTFVAFQDSDDEWLPYKLQVQVDALRAHPGADAVFCNALREEQCAPERAWRPLIVRRSSGYVEAHELQERSLVGTPTLLVRRSCLDVECFDETLGRLQDFDLVIRLSERISFYYTALPLLWVLVQGDSISADYEKTVQARTYLIEKYPGIMDNNPRAYAGMLGSIRNNQDALGVEDVELARQLKLVRALLAHRDRLETLKEELRATRQKNADITLALKKHKLALRKHKQSLKDCKAKLEERDARVERLERQLSQTKEELAATAQHLEAVRESMAAQETRRKKGRRGWL